MIKPLRDFMSRFGTNINLNEALIVKRQSRYFLLSENLERHVTEDFFYAGTYLGKVKDGKLFPSFNLLDIMAKRNANTIAIDKKTEWLFICGRDIFNQGITKAIGPTRRGSYVLISNSYGECLGFGKILHSLSEKKQGPAVQNILDIGDFLRRER